MFDYKDKRNNVNMRNKYMLGKTLSMFKWEELPNTIPIVELELMLQTNGYAFITEVNGELYAFEGGFGGESDVYNRYTEIIISNQALNFNKTLNLEKDGVLIRNDDLQIGLLPLYDKYNTFLMENDITMIMNNYNKRIQTLLSADEDSTIESAKAFLDTIIEGEFGVVADNPIFEGLQVNNTTSQSNQSMDDLINYHQYMKATLYNEVGLQLNANMKRARLNTDEVKADEESLLPFIDNMLANRERAVKELNGKYGLDISVSFGSIWEEKENEEDNEEGDEEVNEEQPNAIRVEVVNWHEYEDYTEESSNINSDPEERQEVDDEVDEEEEATDEADQEADQEVDEEGNEEINEDI